MQIFRVFFSLFLFFALVSCEKELANKQGEDSITSANITDLDKSQSLNIKQAQEQPNGTAICVKGYIAGSTQQSMANFIYTEPFKGSSAIVLSPRPIGESFSNEYLFPVCLTDAAKGIREKYNLEDNPKYWNQYVYISGIREKYMGTMGLKKVGAIEIVPNHQPDAEEEAFAVDNDGDNSDNNNDDIGDNDNDGGNDNGDDDKEEHSVTQYLTVAQAKQLNDYEVVTVQGYIVATATVEIKQIDYTEPFEYNTSIILADKQIDPTVDIKEQFDMVNYTDLFPIKLPSSTNYEKEIRAKLNLKDHPENQNRIVQIKGTAQDYLGVFGMKDVTEYKFITNE